MDTESGILIPYIDVDIRTHIHKLIHVHVHLHIHVHVYVYVYIDMYMCIHARKAPYFNAGPFMGPSIPWFPSA